jgi:lysozyme
MSRQTPACGIALIKKRETVELRVYDDKNPDKQLQPGDKVEGRLTAGIGHTGPDVIIGMQVTPDLVEHWFALDLRTKVESPIYMKIGDLVDDLSENQYGALCCFVFNVGVGNPKNPEWTIWAKIRARQFDQVPAELIRFVNWNGQKSSGLVARRTDEIALWDLTAAATDPRSSVTQAEPTPPTPADTTPMHKSGTIITAVATAAATAPSAVNQAIQALTPYSTYSDKIGHILTILGTIGAGMAVIGVVLAYLNHIRSQS